MKVIFLDHDGVICLSDEHGSRHKRGTKFDRLNKKAVKVLNEIITETGAEIVISSDWRLHAPLEELQQLYRDENIIKVPIACTDPNFINIMDIGSLEYARIDEIQKFLLKHPEITTWVAVDDLEMYDLGEDHFVCCKRRREGIKQTGIKEQIIKLLNNGK
jgi:hypothetical protein